MLTLLIAALVVAAIVGVVGVIGIGSLTIQLGKMLFCCAIVVMLISAVVGIARGRARV